MTHAPRMTAQQAKVARAQLAKELRSDLRKKDKVQLAKLREAIAAAKAAKRERMREVTSMCKSERARLKVRAAELRAQLRETLRAEREAAKDTCSTNRTSTRKASDIEIEGARRALSSERHEQRVIARVDAPKRNPRGKANPRAAAERRQESDDEVRHNLDPQLVPVFDKVRRGISGSARRSRTEAFLEWVHDHPYMVWEILEAKAADDLKRLEREEAKLAREMRNKGRYASRNTARMAAHLAEDAIPF